MVFDKLHKAIAIQRLHMRLKCFDQAWKLLTTAQTLVPGTTGGLH